MSKHSITTGQMRQLQRVGQRLDIALRIDRARQTVARESTHRFRRAAQIFQHVAQLGGLLEIEFRRRLAHLVFERRDHFARMPFEEIAGLRDTLAIQLRR